MLFNDPRATERDNQNALRKYPFSDAASCAGKPGVIPPGAIVDAQLYVPGREPGRVWMSSIDTDGKLHFSDSAGEFAVLSAKAAPESAVPVTFTGDGGPCPGGVVVFGREAAVSALLAMGGQRFTVAQTELAPAAVAWPGLPGVFGFRLDDGHVVYGDVKIRGENGCVVSTYVEGTGAAAKSVLRISAMGRPVGSADTTGFVTKVVFTSDNTTFVVSKPEGFDQVVDLQATGVSTLTDDLLNMDQDDLCANVRAKLGSIPSKRVSNATACEDGICSTSAAVRKIRLHDGNGAKVVWTTNPDDSFLAATRGLEPAKLISSQIARPSLPYDAEVEYLESTGTQWIDTGVQGRDGLDFAYRASFSTVSAANGIGGEYDNNGNVANSSFYLGVVRANGYLAYHYDGTSAPIQVQQVQANRVYDIAGHFYSGSQYMTVDGVRVGNGTIERTFTSSRTLYLFSINFTPQTPGMCRFYNFSLSSYGQVLRNMIPVRFTNELGQSEGAMYDRVSGRIFRNANTAAGSAPFLYGDDVYVPPSGDDSLRFAGYFDEDGVMYYRYDGTPVRRFDRDGDLDLYARFVAKESSAEVTFAGYGTLHIAAPSDPTYSNPLRISGLESPVPVVQERQDQAIEAGGADALADILLHPAVPAGEVRIGLRGADKAAML